MLYRNRWLEQQVRKTSASILNIPTQLKIDQMPYHNSYIDD